MRKNPTQPGYTIKPNEHHPTRVQRVDNGYETGLTINKTIPNRKKDMIARYIKASFLQTYSDPKNNDPVQIGASQDNTPLKGPQHNPKNRYRVMNSGRWKDLRRLFDSDTEEERDIEDIKEDEAKAEIMLRNSET